MPILQINTPSRLEQRHTDNAIAAAGETAAKQDLRDSVTRKDSGMSGLTLDSPEVAAPKTRDFAITPRNMKVPYEMHDKSNAGNAIRPNSTIHYPNKENLGMWQRLKVAMPTKLGVGK